MKRLTSGLVGAVLGLGLLMAPLSTANAQFGVGIFVGGSFLTGDVGESFSSGWLAGLFGSYRFGGGESAAAVRLDIMYGENNEKEPSSASPGSTFDGKLKLTYFLGYLVIHILPPETSKVDLYFGGGGGFVSSKFTSGGFSSGAETDGALSGLFGVAIPLGDTLKLFFEGKWVTVFTSGSSSNIIPAEVGVELSF